MAAKHPLNPTTLTPDAAERLRADWREAGFIADDDYPTGYACPKCGRKIRAQWFVNQFLESRYLYRCLMCDWQGVDYEQCD